MLKKHFNQIFIIFLILVLIGLVWVLNQRKNFNPVFSLQTNLSFKSDKNLDYSQLSSTYEILELLKKYDPSSTLNPVIKSGDFSVIGREINSSNISLIVYEYSNFKDASKEFDSKKDKFLDQLILYKNLLILNTTETEVIKFLKENLK